MPTVEYRVPNIRCKHCVGTIKREIGEVQGVSLVEANEDTKQVSITFDTPASEEAIVALMDELGYPVKK